jgi:hypothetical protein
VLYEYKTRTEICPDRHPIGTRLLVTFGLSDVQEVAVMEWAPNGAAVKLLRLGHVPCWCKTSQVDVFDVLDPNGGDWTAPDTLHG